MIDRGIRVSQRRGDKLVQMSIVGGWYMGDIVL